MSSGSRRRLKQDKWRNLLRATEQQYQGVLQKLQLEQARQQRLLQKWAVLQQIAQGQAAAAAHLSSDSHMASSSSGQLAIQQLEAAIQEQLLLLVADEGCPSSNETFFSTQVLRCCLAPDNMDKVRSMPVEAIITRLRTLAGKCALLLLNEPEDEACWDKQALLERMHSQQQQQQLVSGSSSRASCHTACSNAAPAGEADAAQGDSGVQQGGLASRLQEVHPALEFTTLALTVMLCDDEAKFTEVLGSNLEARQRHFAAPPSHWLAVGRKLQLTDEQVCDFDLMYEVLGSSLTSVQQQLEELAQQQGAILQAKQAEPWGARQFADADAALKQEQEVLVRQSLLLKRWAQLGLLQGCITLNCLSLRQITIFTAASYPCLPDINNTLTALHAALQQQQQGQKEPQRQRQRHQS